MAVVSATERKLAYTMPVMAVSTTMATSSSIRVKPRGRAVRRTVLCRARPAIGASKHAVAASAPAARSAARIAPAARAATRRGFLDQPGVVHVELKRAVFRRSGDGGRHQVQQNQLVV